MPEEELAKMEEQRHQEIIQALNDIISRLEPEEEIIEEKPVEPTLMELQLEEMLQIMKGEYVFELEEEWKREQLELIESKFEEEQKALQELEGVVLTPVEPELVTTVTSNVVLLTGIILVAYAVMEIIRGLLNVSTWLFELPMPAVFKAGIKQKAISPSRKDDD